MANNTVQTFGKSISDREIKVLMVVYTITCLLFVVGVFLPMLTLSKFFIVKNTVSVASSIFELAASGNWLLFVVIFGFSVAMPVLKLRLLYVLIKAQGRIDKTTKKWLNWVHEYGRWGMLDVFVVAVLLVSVKLGAIATVKIHAGLYFFGVAVLLMMLLTHRLSEAYENIESRKSAD